MTYEMKDKQIVIFKNDDKTKDNQPDFKGKIKIDGVEQQVSLWINESKAGRKYFKGSFSEYKNKTNEAREAIASTRPNMDDFDSDLPF